MQYTRADKWSKNSAGTADEGDEKHFNGLVDAEGNRGIDVEIFLRIDGSTCPAQPTRKRQALDLFSEGIDAESLGGVLVVTDCGQTRAKAGARQAPSDDHGKHAEDEGDVVEPDRIFELKVFNAKVRPDQHAEAAPGDRQRICDDTPDFGDRKRDECKIGALEPSPIAQRAD